MRTEQDKNILSTSFTIDLSTVDKKVDKLIKFIENSEIDLKNDGLSFINIQQDYLSIKSSLKNRKYKESLSTLIFDSYIKRFTQTRQKFVQQGLLKANDFLAPGAYDDFGSRFDAFAATNTDPNNAVLIALGTKPYKDLKVDIFEEEEIKTYLDAVASASYDYSNFNFLLTNLDYITNTYLNNESTEPSVRDYIKEIDQKVLNISSSVTDVSGTTNTLYKLSEDIPEITTVEEIMSAYLRQPENLKKNLFPSREIETKIFLGSGISLEDTRALIGEQLLRDQRAEKTDKYDSKLIQRTKIKLIDFLIRTNIKKALEERVSSIDFLKDFKPKYTYYNFLDEVLYSPELPEESKNVKKENLFFRLTYLRQTEEQIVGQKQQSISNLNVEFVNKQFLSFDSPFGSVEKQNENKFVAIIGGSDLNYRAAFDFFNPTILSILSDIDYIDSNIEEIDPFYCPTPQSLQPDTKIEREKYQKNELIVNKNNSLRHFVKVRSTITETGPVQAFNYLDFPSKYFIPNIYANFMDFYESEDPKLTKDKAEKLILDSSKYYYESSADTPSANIIRDSNSNKLFREAALNNGFYGAFEARKDSFADPLSIQPIIRQLDSLKSSSIEQVQDIIFAKTNISCLLKEFQTCFLPKVGNCRDILKGFRFAELEEMLKTAFPESIYTEFYESLFQFKINNLKDEREKKLLQELKDLEEKIKNDERKKIVFIELDKRTEPGKALDIADRTIRINRTEDSTLEEQYEIKLKQYTDLKLGQETPQDALDKIKARKEMDLDELKFIDDFLDLMEKNGINIDILCNIADLMNISPMFGTLQLPEFPEIDIFQEVRLNLDLTIVKIIFDSIVAFIIKILEELSKCGGIKDLLAAALTGEASGSITGAALAAANQLARGKFDIDDFAKQNPQIDVVAYAKSFTNIAKTLNPIVQITGSSQLNVDLDLGIGKISSTAKSKTTQALNITKSSATTEVEIKNSLTTLISELSTLMEPDAFMRLFDDTGNLIESDIRQVENYIQEKRSDLAYLIELGVLPALFRRLGEATGLSYVRNEMVAMSTFYTSNSLNAREIPCLEPNAPVYDADRETEEEPLNGLVPPTPEEIVPTPEDTYRNLIQDLLTTASPETLKNKIDNKVFKPLLIGKLPNGKTIKAVEKAQSEIIDTNFKEISNKFKESCSDFYSNLVVKKPIKREIKKFLKQEGAEEPKDYENPEYKDLINKGGYGDSPPETLQIEEQKFVYGALFVDNFNQSSRNLSIDSTPEQLKVTVTGSRGFSSLVTQQYNLKNSEDGAWKIQNIISGNQNNITFYEGNVEQQNTVKFNFVINKENIDTNSIYQQQLNTRQLFNQVLKESITSSLSNYEAATFDKKFQEYTTDSYNKFLFLIYEKITQAISTDGLLKPINLDSLNKEQYITGLKNGLDSVFPGLSQAVQNKSAPTMVSPNIDTPLKYINFCPKPTRKQRDSKVDPGLFGYVELKEFISQVLNKRQTDVVDTKTLEQMFEDEDNLLKFALIDGLYISLIRTACTEISIRALFPLRVFGFNKRLIEDMMLPTYIAEMLLKEMDYKIIDINRKSLFDITVKHIDYLHNFIFSEEIDKQENNKLFKEVKSLKKQIKSLEDDMSIMRKYLGKISTEINPFSEKAESQIEFKKKIQNYISCLNDEIKAKEKQILLLQMRNICYNELIVIFDKLSYITSTNEKVKEELGEVCRDIDQNLEEKDFLSILIPELLIKSDLKQVTTEFTTVDKFIKQQENKYKPGSNLIIEHYINVPHVKSKFTNLANAQSELGCFGAQTFENFEEMLERGLNVQQRMVEKLNDYFNEEVTYNMRVVFVPDTQLNDQTSIDFDFNLDTDSNKGAISENLDKLFTDGKSKFFVNGLLVELFNNRNEKTYAIPFMGPELREGQRKFGLINAFPIIKETLNVSEKGIQTPLQMIRFMAKLKAGISNELTDSLKLKISCNQKLKQFYSIFTNENLLSNLTILSSIGIVSGYHISTSFTSLRNQIITKIYQKMMSIYDEDQLAEFMERLSTIEFFKDFNAGLMAKTALIAAVYVLQYYCQMTDPNISTALILRNAVKLSLSLASQIPNPLGQPAIPKELPLALSPLALYSLGQLPINVFGAPPFGVGVGPPLTVPGFILLGADLLLLSLEFAQNLDFSLENDKIKEELKKYCFDLSGYKKYGM